MSLRPLLLRGLAIAVCGGGSFFVHSVMAGDPAPSSPTPTAIAATNSAPRSRETKNGLLRLEDELSKSFLGLRPHSSSLEGDNPPLPTPQRNPNSPSPQNKRLRDAVERRKNWAFMSPEDATASPKTEDFFQLPDYTPEGEEQKNLSPIERFYRNLERKNTKQGRQQLLGGIPLSSDRSLSATEEALDSGDDAGLPAALRESERVLRKKLIGDSTSSAAKNLSSISSSKLWDFTDTGEKTLTPEEVLAQKAYLKQYQQWLDAPQPGAFNILLGTGGQPPQPGSFNGLDAYGSLNHSDAFGQSAGSSPLLVASPADVNAKILNQWNPLYTTPRITVPPTPPPSPVFDVPRRKF